MLTLWGVVIVVSLVLLAITAWLVTRDTPPPPRPADTDLSDGIPTIRLLAMTSRHPTRISGTANLVAASPSPYRAAWSDGDVSPGRRGDG